MNLPIKITQASSNLQPYFSLNGPSLGLRIEAMGCGASTEGDAGTQNARHSEDLTYWPQQEIKCDASGWCGGKQQRGLKVYKII